MNFACPGLAPWGNCMNRERAAITRDYNERNTGSTVLYELKHCAFFG